jgi:hypothetical protein
MELMKISLQDSGRTGGKSLTATEVAINIFKTKGIKGFFHGGTATLVRDVSFSAVYFPLFAILNQKVFVFYVFFKNFILNMIVLLRVLTPKQIKYHFITLLVVVFLLVVSLPTSVHL